jgi:hypothetical protein
MNFLEQLLLEKAGVGEVPTLSDDLLRATRPPLPKQLCSVCQKEITEYHRNPGLKDTMIRYSELPQRARSVLFFAGYWKANYEAGHRTCYDSLVARGAIEDPEHQAYLQRRMEENKE